MWGYRGINNTIPIYELDESTNKRLATNRSPFVSFVDSLLHSYHSHCVQIFNFSILHYNDTMDLDAKIEALLFHKAEPLTLGQIAEAVEKNEAETQEALTSLSQKLSSRGVVLLKKDDEYLLGTAPEASSLIEKITKDELSTELGRAGLETLAIIAYEGPISRPEIDYIRGVNSSFILRNLMVRGLIERVSDKDDSRRFLYRPTFELLRYLGVKETNELPEFETIREKIEDFKKQEKENETNGNDN